MRSRERLVQDLRDLDQVSGTVMLREAADMIEELAAALLKIVDGPPAGLRFDDAGGPFEKFACAVAYDALQKTTVTD